MLEPEDGKRVSYTIRRINLSDLHEISEIERICFTTAWSLNAFMEEFKNPGSLGFVAIQGKEILGYIFGQIVLDESHILDLAVKPGYRRRGIATALVKHLLREFKSHGCRTVYLEVRCSNIAALTLYRKVGFYQYGIRKEYYQFPLEDAILMKKDITA